MMQSAASLEFARSASAQEHAAQDAETAADFPHRATRIRL